MRDRGFRRLRRETKVYRHLDSGLIGASFPAASTIRKDFEAAHLVVLHMYSGVVTLPVDAESVRCMPGVELAADGDLPE